MSGLRDRIFPRSDASASEPEEGAAPATPPATADESRAEPASTGSATDQPTGETSVLPVAEPPRRSGGLLRRRRKEPAGPADGAGPPVPAAAPGPAAASAPAADPTGAPGAVVQSPAAAAVPDSPGFAERARLRRRLRYLRKLRELLLRDLGGFVFDARRFGRPRGDIVEAKLSRLAGVDAELRALEGALDDRRPLQELREAGIGGICDVCGAYFPSTAKFCSDCGSPASARRDVVDQSPAASPAPAAPAPAAPASGPAPGSSGAAPAPVAPTPPSAPGAGNAVAPAGTTLWSTGASQDQSTPPSGVEPLAALPPEPQDATVSGDAQAGEPSGIDRGGAAAGGVAPPGDVARPEDESATPPPMSSGDPLQQR